MKSDEASGLTVGSFGTLDEAAEARKQIAAEKFGEFSL